MCLITRDNHISVYFIKIHETVAKLAQIFLCLRWSVMFQLHNYDIILFPCCLTQQYIFIWPLVAYQNTGKFSYLETAQTWCPISICWILSHLGRFCLFSPCFLPFCNEEFHFCNWGCCNLYVQKTIPILKIHLESISHLWLQHNTIQI